MGVAVAGVAALAVALGGCSAVQDVLEGRALNVERLGVDGVLRALTAELATIDGVESARYHFDALDVSSLPGVEVELAHIDYALWVDVVERIEVAGDNDALEGYVLTAALSAEAVRAHFDTDTGATWLTEPTLRVAADATSVFPGSVPMLSGVGVALTVPSSAEELFERVDADPEVARLLADAKRAGPVLTLSTDGLELSGAVDAVLVEWARERLAGEVSRLGTAASGEPQPEWVWVSIAPESVGASWMSATTPGDDGPVWEAYLATIRAGVVLTSAGDCVPTTLSFGSPGVSAVAYASCDPTDVWIAGEERAPVAALRAALADAGVIPEELGFTLG